MTHENFLKMNSPTIYFINYIGRMYRLRYIFMYFLYFLQNKLFYRCWIMKRYSELNKPGTRGRLRKGLQIPMDGLTG